MHIMQAGDDMASKLMIAGIPLLISIGGLIFTERMARLEAVVMENAKQLNKLSQDMAAVCQATGARCR